MAKSLGPVEVCCESPPYRVVQSCRWIGINHPEDVRWLRLSTFRELSPRRNRGAVTFLRRLFASTETHPDPCTCGKPLPALEDAVVAFDEGEETIYFIGQCSRCQTVFWDLA